MTTPVDPYVLEVAAALTAAGHNVTETWTEATDPTDHNIAIQIRKSTLVLVWDEQRHWVWIAYPAPNSSYSAAGTLIAVHADPSEVVAAVAALITRPIFG
jgi:hypothetical protein